jgi:adenylate cyclase
MISLRSIADTLQKSRRARVVTVALLGTGIGLGLSVTSLFDTLELQTLDIRFRYGAHAEWADTSIAMIAVDQNSLDFIERTWGMKWPWPREYYGLLLEYLERGKPRLVAFDYDFSQRDVDRLELDGAESDGAFAEAMARAGNVVLGLSLGNQETGDQPGDSVLAKHCWPPGVQTDHLSMYDRAGAPLLPFQEAAAALGVTNFSADDDGIARRAPLIYRYRTNRLPHFALACYEAVRAARNTQASSPAADRLQHGETAVLTDGPLDNDGNRLVYWYGRGGPDGVFRYYSIHSLILSAAKMRQGLLPDVPPDLFRDKMLVVGGTAAGLYDFKPTPFTYLEQYPGMEIQATLLSNLLNGHSITHLPWWLDALLTLLLAFGTAFIFFRVHRIAVAFLLVLVLGALYGAVAMLAFRVSSLWIPAVVPVFGIATTYALAAVESYAIEGRQKRVLRKAFNRYFSPNVVADILENADQLELGGKTIEATVYFSDIKDFTSIAENFTPKDLVLFLNEYFSLASDVILKNEAMLDKYIGDAIMAIFGAPIPRADNATVACLTALEIQSVLASHHARPDRDPRMPTFVTRIGLNTGKMVVGNIGSNSRLDYTAIGDTVNLASRLEGVNKLFGTTILISETTHDQAREAIVARQLDFLRVKGKAIPVRIYELVGARGQVRPAVLEKIGMFEEAIALYRSRKFAGASSLFQNILSLDPSDGPSTTFVQRCAELGRVELSEDWDGVFTLTSK